MDEINSKCQSAIDHENTFLLSYIPGLNILISTENPLYVDQIFPKYRYMSLLQYSVAAKKPKSLGFLLNYALSTCKIPLKRIIEPKNTPASEMNLIALAIEFHSNECLKSLVKFILENQKDNEKINFDIEDQFGETPLIKALRDRNNEASLILLNQCNADLLHVADENSILQPLLPILVFLLNYPTSYEIDELWKQIKPEIREAALEKLKTKLKFDNNFRLSEGGDIIQEILQKKDLIEARNFIIEQIAKPQDEIVIVEGDDKDDQQTNKPKLLRNQDNADNRLCFKSECNNIANKKCPKCGQYFCDECFENHICHFE